MPAPASNPSRASRSADFGQCGYRMIAALTARELGIPVNRKRVLRVMRLHRLIQRHRPLARRRRPGTFAVTRPNELWHLDMTSIWVAEAGWTYLNAAIDCCTRKIAGWSLELRCRAEETEAVIATAVVANGVAKGELTLGTDNGSAYTARRFRARLGALGVRHRRGGYRDPESQAFIESWFGKLKEREVWRTEYETLEQARAAIAAYIADYHDRPHSGLGYRTPQRGRRGLGRRRYPDIRRGLRCQQRWGAGHWTPSYWLSLQALSQRSV